MFPVFKYLLFHTNRLRQTTILLFFVTRPFISLLVSSLLVDSYSQIIYFPRCVIILFSTKTSHLFELLRNCHCFILFKKSFQSVGYCLKKSRLCFWFNVILHKMCICFVTTDISNNNTIYFNCIVLLFEIITLITNTIIYCIVLYTVNIIY